MTKAELIDAIASGSKLTKADAGRFSNPGNSNSTDPRGSLAFVAAFWNVLTEGEQQSWNDVAVQFPFKNKFGDIYTGSGYQVFMRLNSNLRLINQELLRSGPVADFPVLPPILPPSGEPEELLRFTFVPAIPEGINILVYACAPVLRGSGFRKGKEKLLMAAPPNATGVIDATYAYQNLFGQVKPNANMYFRFVAVSTTTGQTSVENVMKVNTGPNGMPPKVGFYLPGVFLPPVSAGKDWITPFRIYGFNLTGPAVIKTPIDAGATHQISRNVDGPWVQEISVPLNELKQPRQNVFYFKTTIAVAGLHGTTVTIEAPGTGVVNLGMGGTVIDQFIGDPITPIAFGDVYMGLYTVKEVALPYGALRADIAYYLTGANVDRFQLALDPAGPWANEQNVIIKGTGSDAAAKLYIRTTPGATGAIVATLHADSGGDLSPTFALTATAIDGVISDDTGGAIAYGNAITGERADGMFNMYAVGLFSPAVVLADTLVNCTVEFSFVFAGVYLNPNNIPGGPPTIPPTQIWYSIIPTAAGAFSANINIIAGGALTDVIALSGTGV